MAEATIHKMGPGTLTFGETGTSSEFGGKTKATTLTPTYKSEDPVKLLNGDYATPEDTESWEIAGELYQSYDADNPTTWAFKNAGQIVAFTFVPRKDQARKWTGKCKVRALKDGGDVDKNNTTEFTFPVIGRPALVANTPS